MAKISGKTEKIVKQEQRPLQKQPPFIEALNALDELARTGATAAVRQEALVALQRLQVRTLLRVGLDELAQQD